MCFRTELVFRRNLYLFKREFAQRLPLLFLFTRALSRLRIKLPLSNWGEGRPRALPGRTALKQTERRSALSV